MYHKSRARDKSRPGLFPRDPPSNYIAERMSVRRFFSLSRSPLSRAFLLRSRTVLYTTSMEDNIRFVCATAQKRVHTNTRAHIYTHIFISSFRAGEWRGVAPRSLRYEVQTNFICEVLARWLYSTSFADPFVFVTLRPPVLHHCRPINPFVRP